MTLKTKCKGVTVLLKTKCTASDIQRKTQPPAKPGAESTVKQREVVRFEVLSDPPGASGFAEFTITEPANIGKYVVGQAYDLTV